MTQLELVISFRDKKQNLGLLGPDCTVAKIKDVALTITSAYRLGSSSQILFNITNPENKLKILLDSDFGLECLVALHKRLGACAFEVDVVPVVCPQFKDAPLFQAFLTNLEVVLFDRLITQLNDLIEGHVSIEENAAACSPLE